MVDDDKRDQILRCKRSVAAVVRAHKEAKGFTELYAAAEDLIMRGAKRLATLKKHAETRKAARAPKAG